MRGVGLDRPVIAERLSYAKRLRADLSAPLDGTRIEVPVHVIWGDGDRLTMPDGAAPDAVVAAIEKLAGT